MASPFRVFRKHQKTLLVVAGVVLMFVFVLGDSLSAILRRVGQGPESGMAAGDVAVRWDDGKLTNAELSSLVVRQRIINDFLRAVELEGRMAAADAGVEPEPIRLRSLIGPEMPQQGVEQYVVRMRLYADAARRAGMSVSDENVIHYLEQLGRGRVSRDQMRAMLDRMRSGGRGASIDYVFDALREEMLAHNYLASYQYALATVMPEERWQDWLRVNDRVVVEAAALPVESFVKDVPEPTDAELSEFFDRFKNREPQPDFVGNTELPSPLPGFAIPQKVNIKYLRADYDQALAKAEEEVTDAEIQEFYDANKEFFIRADSGLNDESGTTEATEQPADATAPPTNGATEAAPANQQPEGASSSPAEEGTPPAEPATPPAEPAASPAQPDAPPSGNEAAPATDEGSRLDQSSHSNPFRLTALQQNNAALAQNGTQPEQGGTVEGSATDTVPADSSSTEAAAPAASGGAVVEPSKPVEYQPLDEVRDQIRRQLANQKVRDRLIALMSGLKSQLRGEFSKYFGSVLDAQAAGNAPPAPPAALGDLSGMAREHGLEYEETGPVSLLQLRELPIGQSVDADTNEPLLRIVFSNELELYQPVTTFDVDNNRYLAMKVSDIPRRVPELSEVRDQVVRAWKLQKAAELALARAKELAPKAQEAGRPLAEYFAEDKWITVERTDPFSWLTGGDISQTGEVTFRFSEPDGIVAAGPNFMQTVFELGTDTVGAVLNHDHSIAYVVRVVEHQDTPEQLREAFLAEADQWNGLGTMYRLHVDTASRVLGTSFRDTAGVEWQRPPDQILNNKD